LRKLNVLFKYSSLDIEKVGTLLLRGNQNYFEYDADFIKKGINISPFKLNLTNNLQLHTDKYPAIFGVFDDSLPDGWGLLLMDRFFHQAGKRINTITPLDRLAYISDRAVGALCYEPTEFSDDEYNENIDLYELSRQSIDVLEGKDREILSTMFKIGGSPGGARPKILVGYDGENLISDIGDLPEGYEHWLIKFKSQGDFSDAGKIEYIYYLMAKEAGINISESRLFTDDKCNAYFGTKRFDRLEGNRRVHTHTLSNLLHSNFRYPALDYDILIKVCLALTKNMRDVLQCFKVMLFNILTFNRDDHGKNFSFIMDKAGVWRFAPSYDLMFSYGINGEHSTSINREGKKPTLKDIQNIAEVAGISTIMQQEMITEIKDSISNWRKLANNLDISAKVIDEIEKKHNEQKRLY
jgi:serine/threonine-protein kinase HipA